MPVDTSKLDNLANDLPRRAQQLLDVTAFKVVAGTQYYIRLKHVIDTSDTLNSVKAYPVPGDKWARRWGPGTDYAIYHEMGTVHMEARPFMVPAKEDESRPFQQAVAQLFKV